MDCVIGGTEMADGNAINRVFLRKILYRIDFQLIAEKLQEDLFQYMAENYSDYFSEQRNEQTNSVNIEINPLYPTPPQMNMRPQNIFVLTQQKDDGHDGITLKIGKTFIYLELDLNIATMNIPYYKWFSDIISFIKKSKMFKPTRIGLRKFNLFYILDENICYLDKIFKVPFSSNIHDDNFELENSNNMQVYNAENYSLNFSREYSTGNLSNATIDDKLAHLIAFDFDLYSTQQTVLNDFVQNSEKELTKMNDIIFKFFSNTVKDDIIEQINNGNMLDGYGVIPF